MKSTTLMRSSLAILMGAVSGAVNISSVLNSAAVAQVEAPRRPYLGTDEHGDYYIINSRGAALLPYEWEVVDPDPNGLNVRCREPGVYGRSLNDIPNLPVYYTIATGEQISGMGIVRDRQMRNWIKLGTAINHPPNEKTCYVRANTQFVRPIREILDPPTF